jgi:uncharacterized protein
LIFLDSSFIIALADLDDQFHEKAVSILPSLGAQRVISGLVISESITAVGTRLGAKAARDVFENLLYDSGTKTIFGSKRLYERAMTIYTKYGGRLSFPDSVTVRLMYDQKIKEIVSFDSDFDRVDHLTRIS